ncbi:type II toxin-antitoxin system prevent-host-death family antitoxin [Seongchinamella sediminis]|uniref:Antitoxin n=1 Tax=Seongchinamella sediminis TaxID=2283635 RepID=A0A3L7DV66_9GAMM|nr:type II toxin-antitoxin system prevent-host-death family antitoxin [Seongchinamella sediminis]RLQ21194.1 type II toxin-antitoxin system prevent-host-death family antitoxin [Seongchinamella sediminis]
MRSVNISEFRANLLKYLKLAHSGEEITVTSNGQQMATITPPAGKKEAAREKLRALAADAEIGDIVSPTDEDWEAQQ